MLGYFIDGIKNTIIQNINVRNSEKKQSMQALNNNLRVWLVSIILFRINCINEVTSGKWIIKYIEAHIVISLYELSNFNRKNKYVFDNVCKISRNMKKPISFTPNLIGIHKQQSSFI